MQDDLSLSNQINALNWHHQIDLGGGIITPGLDRSTEKLKMLHLPDNLSGRTVLDIGAWDGYFSFAAEQRGATVLATDDFCWGTSGRGSKAGFDLAKAHLGSKVTEMRIPVEELSPETVGVHDIVLFLGVLYHAEDPLGYLKRIRSVTKGFAVIETHIDMLDVARPALAYYSGATLGDDSTNFFGPNPAAVAGMCHDAGFSRTEQVSEFWGTRAAFHAFA